MELLKPIEFPHLSVDETVIDDFLNGPIHKELVSMIQYRYELLLCELQNPEVPLERTRFTQGMTRAYAEIIDIIANNWRRRNNEMRISQQKAHEESSNG